MNGSLKLFYEEHGHGTPLVLVHGFPLDHTIWDAIVPLLQDQVRVITPDLRGHGQSPVTPGAYSMRLLADDVVTLLDDLKLEKVFLAGHSMGGYASLAFAQAYPQRLAGLALVASQPFADSPEGRQGRITLAGKVEKDGTEVVAGAMPARLTHRTELHESLHQLMLKTHPQGVIGALLGMAGRPDMTEFLANLDLPVLILAGEQDAIIPFAPIQAFSARLRRGGLALLPTAGHMPMLEEPEKTAAILRSWVFPT